jgi:hypothetical protein
MSQFIKNTRHPEIFRAIYIYPELKNLKNSKDKNKANIFPENPNTSTLFYRRDECANIYNEDTRTLLVSIPKWRGQLWRNMVNKVYRFALYNSDNQVKIHRFDYYSHYNDTLHGSLFVGSIERITPDKSYLVIRDVSLVEEYSV